MTENTQIFIEFNVEKFFIKNVSKTPIPCSNKNYIFAHFKFSQEWDNVEKTAVFTKDDIVCHIPIVDNKCAIPNELMLIAGIIEVSVFGGDRITTGNTILKVVESGFHDESEPPVPLDPTSVWVKSPDGSVSLVREVDGVFQYFTGDEWKNIISGDGFDMAELDALKQDVSNIQDTIETSAISTILPPETVFNCPAEYDLKDLIENILPKYQGTTVTINITAPINLDEAITFKNLNYNKIIIQSSSFDNYIQCTDTSGFTCSNDTQFFKLNNTEFYKLVIANIKFIGSGKTGPTTAIHMQGIPYVVVRDCQFVDLLVAINISYNTIGMIHDNTFTNCGIGLNTYRCGTVSNVSAMTFSGCTTGISVDSCSRFGSYGTTPCIFTNCTTGVKATVNSVASFYLAPTFSGCTTNMNPAKNTLGNNNSYIYSS